MNSADEFDITNASKRAKNLSKHGVDFAEAYAFDWDTSYTREDDDAVGEQRFVSVGMIYGVVHIMVWTERDEKCRLISLRKASRPEIKAYEG